MGTGLSSLSPTITISACATINPNSGTTQDFSGGPATYTVTAMDGTPQDWEVTITEAPNSVGENGLQPEWVCYPSPTTGLVMIEGTEIEKLVIYDASGRLVKSEQCSSQQRVTLDLSDQAPGYYIISIQGKAGSKNIKTLKH